MILMLLVLLNILGSMDVGNVTTYIFLCDLAGV